MNKLRIKQFACMSSVSFLALIIFSVSGTVVCADEIRDNTVDAEVLFESAMRERGAGNYDASVVIFQTILNSQPKLHRARLEMAVAYYKLARYQEALNEAEIVLNAPDTPPDVRVSVLKFISQIMSESK